MDGAGLFNCEWVLVVGGEWVVVSGCCWGVLSVVVVRGCG